MQPPPSSGSYYFNYKHTHSVVLLAVVGPDYECIYADIGTNAVFLMVLFGTNVLCHRRLRMEKFVFHQQDAFQRVLLRKFPMSLWG